MDISNFNFEGAPLGLWDAQAAVRTEPPRHQQCSLCLELYKSPRILPCFHTYCLACLEQLVAHTPGASSFKCPDCRTVVQIPPGGVGHFQVNFYVEAAMESMQTGPRSTAHICDMCGSQNATTKCVDCEQFACDNCTAVHARIGATRSHTVLNLNAQQLASPLVFKERYCNTHKDERIRFFCNQCNSVLCRDCKLTSHEGHPTVELSQRSEDAKKMLFDFVGKADLLVPKLKQSLKRAEAHTEDVARDETELLSKLQQRADEIKRTVDQCLREAQGNLRSQSAGLKKEMTQTVEDMQQKIACLESLCQHVRQVATAGCDADVLSLPEQVATFFGCDLSAFAKNAARHYQSLQQQGPRRAQRQFCTIMLAPQGTPYQQRTGPFVVFTNESWNRTLQLTGDSQPLRGGTANLGSMISATIGQTSVIAADNRTVNQQPGWKFMSPRERKRVQMVPANKMAQNTQQPQPSAISQNIAEIQSVIGQWYDPNRIQSYAYEESHVPCDSEFYDY